MTWGCVLADSGYGISAAFRQVLSVRGPTWVAGIPRIQKVYRANETTYTPVSPDGVLTDAWPTRG